MKRDKVHRPLAAHSRDLHVVLHIFLAVYFQPREATQTRKSISARQAKLRLRKLYLVLPAKELPGTQGKFQSSQQ